MQQAVDEFCARHRAVLQDTLAELTAPDFCRTHRVELYTGDWTDIRPAPFLVVYQCSADVVTTLDANLIVQSFRKTPAHWVYADCRHIEDAVLFIINKAALNISMAMVDAAAYYIT